MITVTEFWRREHETRELNWHNHSNAVEIIFNDNFTNKGLLSPDEAEDYREALKGSGFELRFRLTAGEGVSLIADGEGKVISSHLKEENQ